MRRRERYDPCVVASGKSVRPSLPVISTEGPASPGWNGEISPGTRGAPGHGAGPSAPRRSAQDAKPRSCGFTLIELLVVISIVVLLMAMLMPALSRARKQARAVVCQASLKQWGLHGAMLADENGGTFRVGKIVPQDPAVDWLYWGESSYVGHLTPTVRVCPMASRPAVETPDSKGLLGGTFRAWRLYYAREHRAHYGTYGLNPYHFVDHSGRTPSIEGWGTTDVRGADRIPVMLDSAALNSGAAVFNDPPECDAIPVTTNSTRQQSCINRHNGGVNGLFLDWSVREVGLKELWTLKWYKNYETAGPWTKAGGVQREDWPQWMRRFKQY